jgi:hypothetical protein
MMGTESGMLRRRTKSPQGKKSKLQSRKAAKPNGATIRPRSRSKASPTKTSNRSRANRSTATVSIWDGCSRTEHHTPNENKISYGFRDRDWIETSVS